MSADYEKLGVFYLGREYDAVQGGATATPILYDSKDLTTHAVCVGMTGSGKTGLCLALLEEAAIDGIPAICIDPKGDIGNLLLSFPQLAPGDFTAWVDPAEATRKGLTPEQLGAQTAASWRRGLAEWDQPPERVARFRDAADLAIYTPGASTGLALSVLRSLGVPPAATLADATALREQIGSTVSALLALLGRDTDPVRSRDHILMARIIEAAWLAGTGLDLAALIGAVQRPGFERLGAFELETFYPARERQELAMALNGLLASPGFAAWLEGEPLDAQRLLYTPEGKPRISVISIAHLGDAERMFIVTLVLNELVAWMRRQGGTSSLRALFYMDEIFGYFPPTANPPSKLPMLTLLKQARAFGLGVVLATQNPVDLDYRGLGNCGTWFIGRLQTERDKLRIIEGLTSAPGGTGLDQAELGRLLAALKPRVFVLRNAREDAPHLMQSRWALSYLRGPLTGPEIARLMAPRKAAAAGATAAPLAAASATAAARAGALPAGAMPATAALPCRPLLPSGVREYFLPALRGSGTIEYRPMIAASAKLHFVDARLGLDLWQTGYWIAPLADDGASVLWAEKATVTELRPQYAAQPQAGARFASSPAAVARADSYAGWSKALAAHLYETARAQLRWCAALKTASNPGESDGDFRARLGILLREQRDARLEQLRASYAPKFAALQERLQRAEARAAQQRSQLSGQKLQTAVAIGAAILGAFLGRRAVSSAGIGRAASAVRSATRIGQERQDVEQADESAATLAQRLTDLKSQCDAEAQAIGQALDPATVVLSDVQAVARKSDIAVGEIALAWLPWRCGADGFPAPAC
ncbi:MAG: ATP-binding protein [Gammaproteobacteria bacterium]|nr:ATP-binding protein [Gammaproteobacteria bacterium]